MKNLLLFWLYILPIISSSQSFNPDWKVRASGGGELTANPGWKLLYLGEKKTSASVLVGPKERSGESTERKIWNKTAINRGADYYSATKYEQYVYIDDYGVDTKGHWVKFYKAVPITSDEKGKREPRYKEEEWLKTYKYNYKTIVWDGPFEENYESGQLKIQATNEDGQLNGILKEYYQKGQLKKELTYKKNVLDGPFKSYYKNGQLKYEANLKHSIFYGPYKKYAENGLLNESGNHKSDIVDLLDSPNKVKYSKVKKNSKNYTGAVVGSFLNKSNNWANFYFIHEAKNGFKDGLDLSYYHIDGQLATKSYYKGGLRSGIYESYGRDGGLKFRDNYEFGSKEGVCKEYYKNGQLKSRENYRKGKRYGPFESYYKNGELMDEGNIIGHYGDEDANTEEYWRLYWKQGHFGIIDGPYLKYHENGWLYKKVNYVNGKWNGLYLEYDEKGELVTKESYKDDKLVPSVSIPKTEKSNTGTKSTDESAIMELPDGPYKLYYKNGKLKEKGNYRKGKLKGWYYRYYENGKLHSITIYLNGKINGGYIENYKSGKRHIEAYYLNGEYSGFYLEYDENGDITTVVDYGIEDEL